MRPNPCLPSDTIVAYMSPFATGAPPASSSGRGRGSISASLFTSRWAVFFVVCGLSRRSIFPLAVRVDPFYVPPACGEKRPLGPACGRGQLGDASFSCRIFPSLLAGWDACLWDFSAVRNFRRRKCLVTWSGTPSATTSSGAPGRRALVRSSLALGRCGSYCPSSLGKGFPRRWCCALCSEVLQPGGGNV